MKSITYHFVAFHLVIAAPVAVSAASALRIPALQSSPLAISRHLFAEDSSAFDESCRNDMMELQRNSDLSGSLQNALDAFNTDFNANPSEYCSSTTIRSGDVTREINCFVDFEEFSSDYRSICRDLEAENFPVTLFLQCFKSDSILEMELANVPTCLAHECDRVETGMALDRLLLESNNQQTNNRGTFAGFSCNYYKKTQLFLEGSGAMSISNRSITAIVLISALNIVALALL